VAPEEADNLPKLVVPEEADNLSSLVASEEADSSLLIKDRAPRFDGD